MLFSVFKRGVVSKNLIVCYNERMKNAVIKCVASFGAALPEYKSQGAAGADIRAFLKESVTIQRGKAALIPTGLFFEIPEGFEAQVRPRSGLAAKHGITVLNSPGTIDNDYRGEIKVLLVNFGDADFTVKNGDRIAQIVISSVAKADFVLCESLSETKRGESGFGSTGVEQTEQERASRQKGCEK